MGGGRCAAADLTMAEPRFFPTPQPLALVDLLEMTKAVAPQGADLSLMIGGVAPLDTAGPGDLTFFENPAYSDQAGRTTAGVCLVSSRFAGKVATGTIALVTPQPYKAYAAVAAKLYPSAMRPGGIFGHRGIAPGAQVHPEARLEGGVTVDPGAVIGAGSEIGAGTVIAANAVIGPGVRIGRHCSVGPNATILHALVGDRVILHAGVRIGSDGFGFAMGAGGHQKVPQIGRVIVQDDVEIGAGSCVDRGASRDTVIGEGTKIDNLVQIAHNVTIGRHCIIVSQVGISGSTTLGDYVVLGGQVGIVGHVTIGSGSQIAGSSSVNANVPPGSKWGGTPAKPIRDWFREVLWLNKMANRSGNEARNETKDGG